MSILTMAAAGRLRKIVTEEVIDAAQHGAKFPPEFTVLLQREVFKEAWEDMKPRAVVIGKITVVLKPDAPEVNL